jgi:diguanylate cyclase (GGDEF)-like protein
VDATTSQLSTGANPSAATTAREGGARAGVKVLYSLFAAVLVAYWISLIARKTGDTTTWLDGWGVAGFELLVSSLVLLRAALEPRDRRYALLLGVGGCAWALGDFAMTHATLGGAQASTPSLANFLWAGFFPFAYLGLLVVTRRDVVKVTGANILDGAIVVLVAASALVAFGFHAILHASGEPVAWVATNIVYPIADVPALGLTILCIALLGARGRGRWYLFALAALANVAGDTVALFPKGIGGSHFGFVVNSAAWPTSLFLISCAVWVAPNPSAEPRENDASGFMIAAIASVLALLILVVGTAAPTSVVAVLFAVATLVASGARFGLALRRLNALTEQRHGELERAAAAEQQRRAELEGLEQELTTQLERGAFATRLSEALEMADEQQDVFTVVEHATAEISKQTPMELLLADSSRANLSRAASNPAQPAPGCPVQSPFSCVAVRRGTAVVFDSSESLNACPHLRGRESGPCSAVCVPVSFMGRALGVMHTTGPAGEHLSDEAVSRLTVLAGQAGVRIGTVRAFEKTQLQASTDALTGLVNRRTAEQELRRLIESQHLFAIAIADLDMFKQLNDAHGHEAGDRALRLFAQTATQTLRDHDLVARWGGEEFVIVLPELDRVQAVNVLDRVRHNLAASHHGGTATFTASFGVADSGQSQTLEGLLNIADAGLYHAKESGRDQVVSGDAMVPAQAKAETDNGHEAPAQDPIVVARKKRPPIHEAADEHDPRPNGVQIR